MSSTVTRYTPNYNKAICIYGILLLLIPCPSRNTLLEASQPSPPQHSPLRLDHSSSSHTPAQNYSPPFSPRKTLVDNISLLFRCGSHYHLESLTGLPGTLITPTQLKTGHDIIRAIILSDLAAVRPCVPSNMPFAPHKSAQMSSASSRLEIPKKGARERGQKKVNDRDASRQ